MDRRRFVGSGLALGAAAVSGCSIPQDELEQESRSCNQFDATEEMLRVDVHCHLVNHRDANGAAFVARRYLPDNAFIDLGGGLAIRTASAAVGLGTDTVETEIELLKKWYAKDKAPLLELLKVNVKDYKNAEEAYKAVEDSFSDHFCRFANSRQEGIVLAGTTRAQRPVGAGRAIGFGSSHLRNAAIMMAFWPKVDIFMPLMLDFYEGRGGGSGSRPEDRVDLYAALNLATRGRFVPLVSFNPERELKEPTRKGWRKPLDLVRHAIEEKGFIGVKVHPTAGFNPIDNFRWGCPNTALQIRARLTREEALGYNRAMDRLYQLCHDLEAPIITHGSDSLSSHEACMQGLQPEHFKETKTDKALRKDYELPKEYMLVGSDEEGFDVFNKRYNSKVDQRIVYRHPDTWTNAPLHWREMLKRSESRDKLKVCIAHYASRFQDHLSAKRGFSKELYDPTPGEPKPVPYHLRSETLPPVEYSPHGDLVPSSWLDTVVQAIKNKEKRLYLDLSHMTALAYSEASRRRFEADPKNRVPIKNLKYDDGGRYALAFKKHLMDNPEIREHVMYGTDWHMPEISTVGPSYMELIEGTLPDDYKEDIMGLNAARFFGLCSKKDGTKGQNRQRLETFYKDHGVPRPLWMDRLDDQMNKIPG